MRRRSRRIETTGNRERWLVSYADFITLLFAFFVVMYSVSSVNEGKYKVLSETLTGVFNAPQRSVTPVSPGEEPALSTQELEPVIPPPVAPAPEVSTTVRERARRSEALQAMAGQLAEAFEGQIEQGVISVSVSDQWLELSMRDSLLFGSGDAEPHYDAFPVMDQVAAILRGRDNAIRIEGFTDDRPIRTADVTNGSAFQVIPHGLPDEEGYLEEKAKAVVFLTRIDPSELTISPERRDWSYDGIVAFSKVCTHVGCPVALYEQQTHHLLCPCHQSTFDLADEAKVVFGPAKRALPQLPITVDDEGYLVARSDFHEPVGPSFWERERTERQG